MYVPDLVKQKMCELLKKEDSYNPYNTNTAE